MARITVDFAETLRKMKPLHGVNNGPWTNNFAFDARPLFKEAGIPTSRLHDTEYPYGSGEFVDVSCIFRNFNADENDPGNYSFAMTDLYIRAILECGTRVIYRLGCSIEHAPVKPHAHPPKDFAKWARICEHIIRHYNEGWADGFHWDLRYWEIWNEPNVGGQKQWSGTVEQFAEFYTAAATHLKRCFPELMIGGPAFTSPENDYVHRFFTLITKDGAHPPMDFYSWHGYTSTVEKAVLLAERADGVLRKYGYEAAESIYDEWNYVKDWSDIHPAYRVISSAKGMAMNAAVMAAMQSTPVTAMCYYDAQMKFASSWDGLFKAGALNGVHGEGNLCAPKKGYFAFKAFNEVYRLGAKDEQAEIGRRQNPGIADQVRLTAEGEGLYAVASRSADGTRGAVLAAGFSDPEAEARPQRIAFSFRQMPGRKLSVYLADETHDLEKIDERPCGDLELELPPFSVLLLLTEE